MKEPLCVCLSAVCLKAAGAQMDFPASFLQAAYMTKYVSSLIPVFLDFCANSYFISWDKMQTRNQNKQLYTVHLSFKWIILYAQKIAFHFGCKQLAQFP